MASLLVIAAHGLAGKTTYAHEGRCRTRDVSSAVRWDALDRLDSGHPLRHAAYRSAFEQLLRADSMDPVLTHFGEWVFTALAHQHPAARPFQLRLVCIPHDQMIAREAALADAGAQYRVLTAFHERRVMAAMGSALRLPLHRSIDDAIHGVSEDWPSWRSDAVLAWEWLDPARGKTCF